jgi:cytochrome P450
MHPPAVIGVLRRRGGVARVQLGNGSKAWLLTRYDDVRAAFLDDRLSADAARPGYPHVTAASAVGRSMLPNFMVMDDPEHARLRALFYQDFLAKPVARRSEEIRRIAGRQVDMLIASGEPADLVRSFAQPIPARVLAGILGIDEAHGDSLAEFVRTILDPQSTGEEAIAANAALIDCFERLLDARATPAAEGVIARLARDLAAGRLARRDILGCVRQLFLAGQDSTTSSMAMGALLLMQHPEQRDRLLERDDPRAWEAAADEIVRFLSVTHFGRRRVAVEDIVIGGQLIRSGEGIILAENYANRDEAAFADADLFDVFRPNVRKHLGFGSGKHLCLGLHLARAELALALSTLFARLPALRVVIPEHGLVYNDDLTIYGVESLPVAWSG